MRLSSYTLLIGLGLLCGPGFAATLVYEGYVAGVRAGSATVELAISDGRYQITGSAAADGVVDWFSDWYSEFSAVGRLTETTPTLSQYVYLQRDGDSRREVRVADGRLHYRKNQRPPRNRPAFATPDLLTALFVNPQCNERWWVNTGRRNYRLERRPGKAGVCRYEVFDRHEDSFTIDLVLGQRFGYRVPISMTARALVRARLVLVEQAPAL